MYVYINNDVPVPVLAVSQCAQVGCSVMPGEANIIVDGLGQFNLKSTLMNLWVTTTKFSATFTVIAASDDVQICSIKIRISVKPFTSTAHYGAS